MADAPAFPPSAAVQDLVAAITHGIAPPPISGEGGTDAENGWAHAVIAAVDHLTALPSFVAVAVLSDGRSRILVSKAHSGGDAPARDVVVTVHPSQGTPESLAPEPVGITDRVAELAPGDSLSVTVGLVPDVQTASAATSFVLTSGVVPGNGVVLWSLPVRTPVEWSSAPTQLDALPDTPVPAGVAGGQPIVEIEGRECNFGHLNEPGARFCARCGALINRSGGLVTGPRPPLGVLELDDGAAYVLDTDLLIGRDPAPSVVDRQGRTEGGVGQLSAIRLDDTSGALSRVHCEVRLVGWSVEVIDHGSVNGTYLRLPETTSYFRLQPEQPVPAPRGSEIRLGGRAFRVA